MGMFGFWIQISTISNEIYTMFRSLILGETDLATTSHLKSN